MFFSKAPLRRPLSQEKAEEIRSLSEALKRGDYKTVSDVSTDHLKPGSDTADAFIMIVIFLGTTNAKDYDKSVRIFQKLVFEDGFDLFSSNERRYLESYIQIALKSAFGQELIGFPQHIRRLKIRKPRLDKVPEDIKSLFLMWLN